MSDLTSYAGRVYTAFTRRGTQITLRQFTTIPGSSPQPNPPTLTNPVVDGAQAAGATALTLRGTEADGRLVVGDTLTVDGRVYTVTAPAASRAFGAAVSGFDAVPISPALAAPVADGDAVTPSYAADVEIYAKIQGVSLSLIDGALIQGQDLMVTVPAFGIPEPQLTWRLSINGRDYTIVNSVPVFVMDEITSYRLQAR